MHSKIYASKKPKYLIICNGGSTSCCKSFHWDMWSLLHPETCGHFSLEHACWHWKERHDLVPVLDFIFLLPWHSHIFFVHMTHATPCTKASNMGRGYTDCYILISIYKYTVIVSMTPVPLPHHISFQCEWLSAPYIRKATRMCNYFCPPTPSMNYCVQSCTSPGKRVHIYGINK